jgi:hypothetical protein
MSDTLPTEEPAVAAGGAAAAAPEGLKETSVEEAVVTQGKPFRRLGR